MIYKEKPLGFKLSFEVVSCIIMLQHTFLLLLRQENKPQGGTWGLPAGKINKGEDVLTATQREVYEETGLLFEKNDFVFFTKLFVRQDNLDFVYYLYQKTTHTKPKIQLSNQEHKNSGWFSYDESKKLPLIGDLDLCLDLFFKK